MTRASLLIVAFLGLSACQDAESLRVDCDDGGAIACYELGVMYQSGEGATQDFARAASLYEQACDGGEMRGCTNLGFARAASLYEQACDGGEVRGCTNLGRMYRDGQGVTQDFARAATLWQQACDGGEVEACIRE